MRPLLAGLLLALLTGCATLPWGSDGGMSPGEQRKKLSQATELVRTGNNAAASGILQALCREKGVPGITDEALFRLGILTMRSGGDKDLASSYLERLRREYPTSSWSKTAGPVLDIISQYEDLRAQVRNLKSSNQFLLRENRELLQNIERLKSLDLELERKTKPVK